jgi:hypothetical protein
MSELRFCMTREVQLDHHFKQAVAFLEASEKGFCAAPLSYAKGA